MDQIRQYTSKHLLRSHLYLLGVGEVLSFCLLLILADSIQDPTLNFCLEVLFAQSHV